MRQEVAHVLLVVSNKPLLQEAQVVTVPAQVAQLVSQTSQVLAVIF